MTYLGCGYVCMCGIHAWLLQGGKKATCCSGKISRIQHILIRCPQILFIHHCFSCNHHSQCGWQLTALSFSPSFAPPHQKKLFLLVRRKKNANASPCALFPRGQSGRGVNEWQSVLITRRGYLGLVCLISLNAFQFLMLPNCRLHRAGPFVIARQSSCIQWNSTRSPELCGRIYQRG